MRAIITTIIATCALCATASAEPNSDEISFGGGTRALRSSSADALTGDNLSAGTLGYARDFGLAPLPGLTIWPEAHFGWGTVSGQMFQSISTDVRTLAFDAGVRARYQLHRLIIASARIDLGAERTRVELSDGTITAADHSWGAMASVGAAIDFFAINRAPFGIGLRAELGYVLAQAISLTPRPDHASDALTLPMSEFALGHLDLSGPTFGVSLLGQF